MEALAVVALAGNVAQFVEYAFKAVSEASKLLKSPDGTLKENIDLRSIAQCVKKDMEPTKEDDERVAREDRLARVARETTRSLRSLEYASESVTEYGIALDSEPRSSTSHEPENDALQDLVLRCHAIAGEILSILVALRAVKQDEHRILQKIEIVTKTLLRKSELRNLRERLYALRDQISAHLLRLLLEQQKILAQNIRKYSTMSEQSCRDIKAKLDEVICEVRETTNRTMMVHERSLQQQEATSEASQYHDFQQRLDKLAHVRDYTDEMFSSAGKKRSSILQTLYFNQLKEREDAIPEAHRETFEWIFNADSGWEGNTSASFTEWLRKSGDVFWVTGKAGSGKSTLMKFLARHHQTKLILQRWAGSNNLIIAKHYFWSPGTPIQKSQDGLLKALLKQIFEANAKLISVACPDRWNSPYADSFDPWSRTQLVEAFENLGKERRADWRICLFIDGLDEYHGDHAELVQVIERIGKLVNIKTCASSRPWVEFSDVFESGKWKLYLHDLTRTDIHNFVRDKLSENNQYLALQERHHSEADSLLLEITHRAQGVFLWVFLVVRSLLRGLTNRDDIHDLRLRLEAFPTDLKKTFDRMLTTIEELYQARTARLFLTMSYARATCPVISFYFMNFDDKPIPKEPLPFVRYWPEVDMKTEPAEALVRKKWQLIAQCKDLIFITPVPGAPELFNERVGFLHRTVVDYIKTEDVEAQLKKMAGVFEPDKILLEANVGQLRSFVQQSRLIYLRPHLTQWVLGSLYYARRIEAIHETAEMELMEDLEAIIVNAVRSRDFRDASKTLLDRDDISSFLELVCRLDMAIYVRTKLPRLDIEELDARASGWRSRLDIKCDAGFELCEVVDDGEPDSDWRLRREVAVSITTSTIAEATKVGTDVPESVDKRNGRISFKLKRLFKRN